MDGRKIVAKSSPRLWIDVTQDVIDTSAVKDSSHCMIAEAIALTIPRARFISVDLATIRFTDLVAGVRYVYLTPRTAQIALLAFDQGEKPERFRFRLESAHVLISGRGSRGKASLEPNTEKGAKDGVPIRVGGDYPPTGPLAGTSTVFPSKAKASRNKPQSETNDGTGSGAGHNVRTGRRRAFGLRAIIR